jgi:riboflavin synthase
MFTGIIEEAGTVRALQPSPKSIGLTIEAGAITRGLKLGDSVAVNGCCLTVVARQQRGARRQMRFDLLRQTWDVTNLQFLQLNDPVNLERPLRAGGRLDGHFVTGHIDGLGIITGWKAVGADWRLDIKAPAEIMRYIVPKGSIAVDGISLTVAAVRRDGFRLWIIPHTYQITALHRRKVGDAVNLEADILGKYVAKFVSRR